MKRRLQVVVIGLGAALLFYQSNAQTNTGAASTNVALVMNIALSGVKQDSETKAAPVRITTKDVLAAASASGGFGVDKNTRLIFLSNEDQEPTIAVEEGKGSNVSVIDLSEFFSLTSSTEVDTDNNLLTYALRSFSFDDQNGTSFNVSGVATLQRHPIKSKNVGTLVRVTNSNANVSGDGTIDGTPMVVRGTLKGSSPQVILNQD